MSAKENVHANVKSPLKPPKPRTTAALELTMHPEYSVSPLMTLTESLLPHDNQPISAHDLIEAYNTLTNRIRMFGPVISADGVDALQRCLSRDIVARDTMLRSYAVCVLSDIFRHPKLNSLFPLKTLSNLFSLLLSTSNSPPSRKIYLLTTLTLRTQTLPIQVLITTRIPLINALKHALQSEDTHVVEDALIGLERLLRLPSNDLLPTIISTDLFTLVMGRYIALPTLEQPATSLISAFACAKLRNTLSSIQISQLSSQLLHFMHATLSQSSESTFRSRISSSLSNSSTPETHHRALALLASLIILHDSSLFSDPQSLKFYVKSHASSFFVSRKQTRQLTADCWKSLVWAYGRIPADDPHKQRAFQVVLQEIRKGIGTAIVWTVMRDGQKKHDNAIRTVIKMVSSSSQSNVIEGLNILQKLAGGGVVTSRFTMNELLNRRFFDNTLFHGQPQSGLDQDIMSDIPQFETEDLVVYWEELLKAWETGVRSLAAYKTESKGVIQESTQILTHILQSLLLVHAELTQGHSHLTMNIGIFQSIGDVIGRLLDTDLTLINKFWDLITRVFVPPYLGTIARRILQAFCRPSVRVDLGATGAKLIKKLVSHTECEEVLQILESGNLLPDAEKIFWEAIVTTEKEETVQASTVKKLLLFPFSRWTMSDYHCEVWTATMRRLTSGAQDQINLLEELIRELGDKRVAYLSTHPRILLALVSTIPRPLLASPKTILDVFSDSITFLYPPNSCSEATAIALQIFDHMRNVILTCETSQLLDTIERLKACLETWIGDKEECVPIDEYNSVLVPLYGAILNRLTALPPTCSLVSISPVLVSAFERMPEPHMGPKLFVEYWEKCWKGKDKAIYHKNLGRGLLDCLGTIPGIDLGLDDEDDIVEDSEAEWILDGLDTEDQCLLACTPQCTEGDTGMILDMMGLSVSVSRAGKRRLGGGGCSPIKRRRLTRSPTTDEAANRSTIPAALSSPRTPTNTKIPPSVRSAVVKDLDEWVLDAEGMFDTAFLTEDAEDDGQVSPDAASEVEQDILASPFVVKEQVAGPCTPSPSHPMVRNQSKKPSKMNVLRHACEELLCDEGSTIGSQDLEEAQAIVKAMGDKIKQRMKGKSKATMSALSDHTGHGGL